ncbi:MAG: RNA polymerase sigma factor [Myxococcota bacterium]
MPKTRQTDVQMLRRAAAGDEQALEDLYGRHVDGLYAFVLYRVGKDTALAEDVVQDTFLDALSRHGDFDPERGSMRAWLCLASRNIIRRQLQAHRRSAELGKTWESIDATLSQVFAALETTPLSDEVLAREDTRDLVNMTIANLPDQYRRVLEHKYVHGESLRELAGGLEVSEDAAKSLLARARRAFREAFSTLNAAFGDST